MEHVLVLLEMQPCGFTLCFQVASFSLRQDIFELIKILKHKVTGKVWRAQDCNAERSRTGWGFIMAVEAGERARDKGKEGNVVQVNMWTWVIKKHQITWENVIYPNTAGHIWVPKNKKWKRWFCWRLCCLFPDPWICVQWFTWFIVQRAGLPPCELQRWGFYSHSALLEVLLIFSLEFPG